VTRGPEDPDVFAAYHRREDAGLALRILGGCSAVLGGVLLVALMGSAAPPPAVVTSISVPTARDPSSIPTPAPEPSEEALPAPAAEVLPAIAPVAVADTGWRIAIDTSGYQAELDQCLWVRMDLGAIAPIVGAHRSCGGGAIVLQMQPGEAVALSGVSLDGGYVVAETRDAHVGDAAVTATEGMIADVILQTCYEGAGGRVRLVALLRT
jgi:hypothetical protein